MPSAGVPVAIVGAGPYGLSLSAYLNARGIENRIVGAPMRAWSEHMPRRMFLKSEGFASRLADPGRQHTLADFCSRQDREYAPMGWPVPVDTFIDYGRWFQRRLVPHLETNDVIEVSRDTDGFVLRLTTDEVIRARALVLAVGHAYFAYIPSRLAGLPPELLSHTSQYGDLSPLAGKDVTVIGAGQSSLETAALLHETGASVRVVVRGQRVTWNPDPDLEPRNVWQRFRHPVSGLGSGWKLYLLANAPTVFSRLPDGTRASIVKRELGPAGAWWLKPRLVDSVPIRTASLVRSAEPHRDRVRLRLTAAGGEEEEIITDHVVAGTGYRVDVGRIPFLSRDLVAGVRTVEGSPVLSRAFESSVPGLFFVGLSAARTFGPLQRFVYGARFAASQLTERLASVDRTRRVDRRAARTAA
jgi:cation diffusion facilitator CzcD-associated flavoprotein CzcO